MLWAVVAVLMILWLSGITIRVTAGGLIFLIVIVAIIAVLFRDAVFRCDLIN